MKEIIESLNLPKQILDKTEKFVVKLFGPSIEEFSELFADKIRHKRLKNQVKIFNKTIKFLEENNLEPHSLNLKTLVPLIEKSSLEEDEELQVKWSNLITNISTSPESGLEPKLIYTLSNLSSLEARILDQIYDYYLEERLQFFEKSKQWKWSWYKSIEDIEVETIIISSKKVAEKFNLSKQFSKIYNDNLESLGVIDYEDPEIEIENGSHDAIIRDEEDSGQKVDLDLDITANYRRSNNYYLTEYGKYFVTQCKKKVL